MNKRYALAALMLSLAFLLWLGATGNADFYGYYSASDYVLIGVGFLLALGAFPVSGDLKKEKPFQIELDFYPLADDLDDQPRSYIIGGNSLEEVKAEITAAIWQVIEIEGFDNTEFVLEMEITERGEYIDSDTCTIETRIVRSQEPSRFVRRQGKPPIIFAIDRAKSSYQLCE